MIDHRVIDPKALQRKARSYLLTHRDRELRAALDRLTECDRIMLALRDASGPLASHAECAAVNALSLARLGSTVTCSGAAARVATERKRALRALASRLEALTGDRRARC